jgi:hypothetical protein
MIDDVWWMSGEDIIELEKGFTQVFKDGIQVPTNQLLPQLELYFRAHAIEPVVATLLV